MLTLAERLRRVADALPDGSSVVLPVADIRAWLAQEPTSAPDAAPVPSEPETWRTRLWSVPDSTRLGVVEVCEALGRSRDWVYRAVSEKRADAHGRDPLPCSRLDGCLSFTAGAVRRWLESSERIVRPEPNHRRLAVHRSGTR